MLYGQNQKNCGNDFVDTRDGTIYPTEYINNQCWMAKNLNIGIAIKSDKNQLNNNIPEKYCYNDNYEYCNYYGGFYQWNELMNYTQENNDICPDGWHLATKEEWEEMTEQKENISKIIDSNTNFNITYPVTTGANNEAKFWTATKGTTPNTAYYVTINMDNKTVIFNEADINSAFSARCVLNKTDNVFENNLSNYSISDPIPNPAKVSTKFIYKLPVGVNSGNIVIYNILGNEVKRLYVDYTNHPVELDVTKFKKGTYFYQLEFENKKTPTKRLIIQ
ncbi:MAG: hypothetical protein Kow0068_21150 [Marinilabiliales bacterium]